MKNIIYSAMITLAISFAITAYSDSVSTDLQNGLIRLHVIADSNSTQAQQIKLSVRDAILKNLNYTSPEAAAQSAEQIANEVLRNNGFGYGAKAQFCTARFPKKEYRELTLPGGSYRAVRVVLGEGKGENWWCVLYPPVCMADVNGSAMSTQAREELRNNLEEETYDVITGDVKVKLRIVELFNKLCGK